MVEQTTPPDQLGSVEQDLRNFLKGVRFGSFKFAALRDFLDLAGARLEVPIQPTLIEFFEHKIDRRSARFRRYREANRKIKEFFDRFENIYLRIGQKSPQSAYRNPKDAYIGALSELSFQGSRLERKFQIR